MSTEKLFTDFKSVSLEQWLEKLKAELKGNLSALISVPERDIELPAELHLVQSPTESAARNLRRKTTDWKIAAEFDTVPSNNERILSALEGGVNALSLSFTNQKDFDKASKGVQFEYISAGLKFSDFTSARNFNNPGNIKMIFDPVSLNAASGKWIHDSGHLVELFTSRPNEVCLFVSGQIYGSAGSTSTTELACSLSHLNEYIHLLHSAEEDLQKVFGKIVISMSCSDNYFLGIAKFRAMRELVNLLFSAYDIQTDEPFEIVGRTNELFYCKNDRYNNLLRQTAQCMSAVLGGCDELIVVPFDQSDEVVRMARNIQLILKEESYFDKVSDAGGGAYAIEHLTDQLIQNAWKQFLEIEKSGGLIQAVQGNQVQQKIVVERSELIAELLKNEKTLIGVNKFRNPMEKWQDVEISETISGKEFEPLETANLEQLTGKILTAKYAREAQSAQR